MAMYLVIWKISPNMQEWSVIIAELFTESVLPKLQITSAKHYISKTYEKVELEWEV